MKIRFLLFLSLLVSGCQSTGTDQDNRIINTTSESPPIDEEPPLRIPALESLPGPVSSDKLKGMADKRRLLIDRLGQFSTIPVPGYSKATPITAEVAHERYITLVKTHQTDSLLPLFQQRYARILLHNYHWLKSGRADIVAYYVDQLLVSRSRDLSTITAGLVSLKPKLPTTQFLDLLNRAKPMAEEQLASEAHQLSEMAYWARKSVNTTGSPVPAGNRSLSREEERQREFLKLRKRYTSDSTSVATLRTLPLS